MRRITNLELDHIKSDNLEVYNLILVSRLNEYDLFYSSYKSPIIQYGYAVTSKSTNPTSNKCIL